MKYDKNCVTIWVQLTEIWISSTRSELQLNAFEVNDLFLELAESFYQVENHFLQLFEERYHTFLSNLSIVEKEAMVVHYTSNSFDQQLSVDQKNEEVKSKFDQTAASLKKAFSDSLVENPSIYSGKSLLKDIEEVLKNNDDKTQGTWIRIFDKLFDFKKFYQLKDYKLELFLYEKAVSCVPTSKILWKLYFEFLEVLPGKRKSLLFNALVQNRKILHYTLPEAFGMCIPYFFDKNFSKEIEDLFKVLIQELLSKDEHIYRPKFRFVFVTSLYALHKANLISEFSTPLQLPKEYLLRFKVDEDDQKQGDSNLKESRKLVRPDPDSEFEIFDMIIKKFWTAIESYDVEDRAEIYELMLNRMKRAAIKEDMFKVKDSCLSPKNILLFKLCIEYKRIVQKEGVGGQETQSSFGSEDIASTFWKKDSKEVAEVLTDLIKFLKSKAVAKLEKMIRFYAMIYVDDVEDLQKVETALFSKIKRLPEQGELLY